MIRIKLSLLAIIVLMVNCKKPTKIFNCSDAQIELKAVKEKSALGFGFTKMNSKDGRFWDNVYPEVTGIPDSLKDVNIYFDWIDGVQALYQAYKAGKVDTVNFNYYYSAWGSDTTNCCTGYVKTFVVIAAGTASSGQRYYLFDSDNDFNLSDEIPYETTQSQQNWISNTNDDYQPHKILFERYIDNQIHNDSTWIAFTENTQGMWLQFCEFTSATLLFDTLKYQIRAYPANSTNYKEGVTFKISKEFNKKSKLLNIGEFIKLGNTYYQITCTADGLKYQFTKDTNAFEKGSTQIGFPPIKFNALTLKGDSISFPGDFKGKNVLLDFWSISCGPCIQEIKDYYIDIYKQYGGTQLEIIGVADNYPDELKDFIKKLNINWIIIPDGAKAIQKKYKINHYPTLFFIDTEGNIIANEDDLRNGAFVNYFTESVQ